MTIYSKTIFKKTSMYFWAVQNLLYFFHLYRFQQPFPFLMACRESAIGRLYTVSKILSTFLFFLASSSCLNWLQSASTFDRSYVGETPSKFGLGILNSTLVWASKSALRAVNGCDSSTFSWHFIGCNIEFIQNVAVNVTPYKNNLQEINKNKCTPSLSGSDFLSNK